MLLSINVSYCFPTLFFYYWNIPGNIYYKCRWRPSGPTLLKRFTCYIFQREHNIYLHFMSLPHIYLVPVVEILAQVQHGPTYSTYSISWLLMSWRRKEPGHQQPWYWPSPRTLTHWGRVTHLCVVKLATIGSDNGLSPGRLHAIIWTNAGILLIRTLGTNFSEILGEIHSFSFKKMRLKMSSAKWRLFGLGLNDTAPIWWHAIISTNFFMGRWCSSANFHFLQIIYLVLSGCIYWT